MGNNALPLRLAMLSHTLELRDWRQGAHREPHILSPRTRPAKLLAGSNAAWTELASRPGWQAAVQVRVGHQPLCHCPDAFAALVVCRDLDLVESPEAERIPCSSAVWASPGRAGAGLLEGTRLQAPAGLRGGASV